MRALVLNSSYQPVTIVSGRRAAVLVLEDLAEIVEGTGTWLRSPSVSVEVPAVVRLRRNVRAPYRYRSTLNRRTVLARDNRRCAYCGEEALTIDHIQPRSRGGQHVWENVVAACKPCNSRKADRTPKEAGMSMRYQPYEPRGLSALLLGLRAVHPSWGDWITERGPGQEPAA